MGIFVNIFLNNFGTWRSKIKLTLNPFITLWSNSYQRMVTSLLSLTVKLSICHR